MKPSFNFTALIYDKRGRILSVGKNSYVKTHPLQAYYANKCKHDTSSNYDRTQQVFLHAEIDAIIKCKDLSKAHKIFISRVNSKGEYLPAAPCIICQGALKEAGIKIIEHT